MRIQLTPRSDDRGAIAVIVALLALVIIGLAAFAVDFGNAYAVKRKLSVAADAAAVAAAIDVGQIVNNQATGCSSGQLTPTTAQSAAQSVAQSTAAKVNGENDLSGQATVTSVTVTCTDQDVRVSVSNGQSVPTFFGSVFGVIQTNPVQSATARIYPPSAPTGLRPIAACASNLNERYDPITKTYGPLLVFMSQDTLGIDSSCNRVTANPGQFDIVDFLDQGYYGLFADACGGNIPGKGGGNAGCQDAWMESGYGGAVWLKNPHAYTKDPTSRTDPNDPGISGNSGGALDKDFRAAIDAMPGKIIQIPVMDWLSGDKVPAITGKNVGDRFGLTGVVTVRVCSSIDENSNGKPYPDFVDQNPIPNECNGALHPYDNAAAYPLESQWWTTKPGKSGDNRYGLWVQPISYVGTAGPVGGPSGCSPYDATCTNHTLVVQLYK